MVPIQDLGGGVGLEPRPERVGSVATRRAGLVSENFTLIIPLESMGYTILLGL